MSLVFPVLAGLDIAVKRSEVFATLVQVSASGKELRSSFWSTPRYHYELTFNFLRQANYSPLTPCDELVALRTFFEAALGQFNTFSYTDPLDGTVQTCRFEQDNLDLEQIFFLMWKGEPLKLVTVK